MIRVGLTGNIASGKSSVARVWADAGVPVVRSDDLAREAVAPGAPALDQIREGFGNSAFAPDGSLDRGRMRDLVFKDAKARARLERILHPHIRDLSARWMEERRREGAALVVNEVPLLFESGLEDAFDVIVVVDAPEVLREERLVSERGISREEARRIMASQGDPGDKLRRADYVIDNRGDLGELREAAMDLLHRLRGEDGREGGS